MAVNDRVLTEQERTFAECYVQTKSSQGAAIAAGYKHPEVVGCRVLKRPRVQQYIDLLLGKINNDASDAISKAVGKGIVKRDWLLERYRHFASLEPEDTNGNINGQVNALNNLAEIMGMKVKYTADISAEAANRTDEEKEYFIQHGYWPERVSGTS